MRRPHFRPRFVLLCPEPVDAVRREIQVRLAASPGLESRVRPNQVLAWIGDAERHVWSPSLDLNLRPHPEGTVVVGLVAPHPKLMTAYVFAAIGLGFLLALSLTWGFVQVTLDEPPWCLIGSALAALALGGVAASRALGLAWARDQIAPLVDLVEGLGTTREDVSEVLRQAGAYSDEVRRRGPIA